MPPPDARQTPSAAGPTPGAGAPTPGAGGPTPAPGPPGRQGRGARLGVLLALLALSALALWLASEQRSRRVEPEEPPAGQAVIVDEEAPLADPERSAEREVVLFFAREGSAGLYPEQRRIFLTSSIADQAKQVVEELIRGSRRALGVPVIPRETQLRQLYLDREGNAYVDFSADLVQRHPGGSEAEIATLYAIVDSLTYNFPEIRSVRILVEGEERDTLAGHLDLRRRYFRDLSRVDPEILDSLLAGSQARASS